MSATEGTAKDAKSAKHRQDVGFTTESTEDTEGCEGNHEGMKDPHTMQTADWNRCDPALQRAFVSSFSLQAILLVVALLVLDGGWTARVFLAAMLCQCLTSAIILIRRSRRPSAVDFAIVRFGVLVWFFAIAFLLPYAFLATPQIEYL
ncbi:hypothetical protein MalM25_14580 [Planctomycetes bacterium MalM25]|nr:hypothetical protein MalM25_14580 [Planctomycetes bacterium MalM25]